MRRATPKAPPNTIAAHRCNWKLLLLEPDVYRDCVAAFGDGQDGNDFEVLVALQSIAHALV